VAKKENVVSTNLAKNNGKIDKSTDSGIAQSDEFNQPVNEPIVNVKQEDPIVNVKQEDLTVNEPIVNVKQEDLIESVNEPIVDVKQEDLTVNEPIVNVKQEDLIESINEPVPTIETNTEFGELLDFGSSGDETPEAVPQSEYVHNRSLSDDRDSTRTRTLTPQPVFSDDEHDSGIVPQTPSPPMTEHDVSEPSQQTNHLFLLNSNAPLTNEHSNGTSNNLLDNKQLDSIQIDESTENNGLSFSQHFASVSSNQVPSDPEQNNTPKVTNQLNTINLLNYTF
jgi:nitrogen fixation protein